MILIIAEKAIAGKRIAALLTGNDVAAQIRDSAQFFEFERHGKQYMVVPLRGHIVDVDFPVKFSHWIGTDLRELSSAPIEYREKEISIIRLLKRVAPQAGELVIATDNDREGESIGLEALNIVKESASKVKIKRAKFSAITKKDIDSAFASLEQVDYNTADSADARREIDLIWGAVLTRLLSLISGSLGKEFLSVGRVQTPVLAIIVDREKERAKFKPRFYWVVSALLEKDGKKFEAIHIKAKFWKKEEADAVLRKKADAAKVAEVKEQKRILARPLPFNTTSFLRAATAIGFSASEAMSQAEVLYQNGLISYPRTDNSAYPPNLDLREILNQLLRVQQLSDLSAEIIKKGALQPSAGKQAKDHPPIHPVSAASSGKLSDRQWKIYELVCRRFMATLADDAETLNKRVVFDINGENFVATGQEILKLGWKRFYPYSMLNEVILPSLAEGDTAKILKLGIEEKQTQPKPRYSQSALIKLMEDLGLGTKSTRHEIISKLYARKYISGQKAIEPNRIAFAVVDSLETYGEKVAKPDMTAELEKEMDLIANGDKKKKEVVDESRELLLGVLDELLKNKDKIGSLLRQALRADSILGPCNRQECDGELLVRRGRSGKRFLGCSNYPKCDNSFPLPQRGKIAVLEEKCKDCGNIVIRVSGGRRKWKMCIDHNCPSKKDWRKRKETRGKPMKKKK